jgi:(hydroxyamino)benzene mutase
MKIQDFGDPSPRGEASMVASSRRVMWLGMFLFLLGMLTAFVEPHLTNVRMGLAAHLVGVLNGVFLIALGAIWTEVRLRPRAKAIAFWTAMYGTYVNWVFTVIAAALGTGAVSPVLAPGRTAPVWQEGFVMAGFISVFPAMLTCAVLVLWGLRGDRGSEKSLPQRENAEMSTRIVARRAT